MAKAEEKKQGNSMDKAQSFRVESEGRDASRELNVCVETIRKEITYLNTNGNNPV